MDGGGGLWMATNFNVSTRKNLSDLHLPQGNLVLRPFSGLYRPSNDYPLHTSCLSFTKNDPK